MYAGHRCCGNKTIVANTGPIIASREPQPGCGEAVYFRLQPRTVREPASYRHDLA